MRRGRWIALAAAALLLLGFAGRAGAAAPDPLFEDEGDARSYPDPFEPANRSTFALNRQIDRWFVDPLVRGYILVVPGVVRRSARHFFENLNSPSTIVNDVLQREWRDAGVMTARTVVNSTVGVAGLTDPATSLGLPRHHSDFGQTLALAGVGSGPYVIMPLLGPTTVRDGLGTIVDFAFRPTTYLLGSVALAQIFPIPGAPGLGDQFIYQTIQGGGTGFVVREENAAQLDALRSSSIDFYATLRNAYAQNREAAIWTDREAHHAIRERALRNHLCRPRGPVFSPTGRWLAPRSRRGRSPQCSRSAATPARSPSP